METLSNIKLSFACPIKWDEMQKVPGGAFCNQCSKKVFDFTNCDLATYRKALQESNGELCGRFLNSQLALPMQTKSSSVRKILAGTLMLVGLQVLSEKLLVQPRNDNANNRAQNGANFASAGIVDVSDLLSDIDPIFYDGDINMFIRKRLHAPANLKTQTVVRLSLGVDEKGKPFDIKIVKGASSEMNDEAIRVAKLFNFVPARRKNVFIKSYLGQDFVFVPHHK